MKKIVEWFRTEFFSRETLIYLITGLISTAINWTVTYILNNFFHLGYWITSGTAFLCSLVFTYFANKKYTFRNTESMSKVLPKYLAEVLICFLLAYGLGKPVLDWFFSGVIKPDMDPDKLNTLKGILANICYIGLNYIGQKFFVFRKKGEEEDH